MKKGILIVRTRDGLKYATKLAEEIKKIGGEVTGIVSWENLDDFLLNENCSPEKTLLHYRTTGPKIITPRAYELEKEGYQLINAARVLDRTGNKFLAFEHAAEHGFDLPVTRKGNREEIKKYIKDFAFEKFMLKPTNSVGQGAFCFSSYQDDPELDSKLSEIPGEEIVFQEFVEYIKIYRVIVIGGKVLEKAVFVDQANEKRWKVSVCLNPEMTWEENPEAELLLYAENIAKAFEGEIAFVDVYKTKDAYVLSEINTACNLSLHEKKSGYNISKDIAEYLLSKV